MSAHRPVAVWQDPRDRVCIAIGDGQPVSLSRENAKRVCERLLDVAEEACAMADDDQYTRGTNYAVQGLVGISYDTFTKRTHDQRGRPLAIVRRVPAIHLRLRLGVVMQPDTVTMDAGDAAALAHQIGRYAVRPYVRKTTDHDGV